MDEAGATRRLRPPTRPRGRRGPAPWSPDLKREDAETYFFSAAYSEWRKGYERSTGRDRNALIDAAFRALAEREGYAAPPPFDPREAARLAGPWLGGMAPADPAARG